MTRTEKEQVRTYKIRICEPVLADKKQIREHVLADRERIREHARADRERIREQVRADYEPPDTVCNVCAEEFGPHNPPKSIPCGHILCGSCVVRVCERSSQRITPCCPFCRESFDSDVVRSVPVDYEAAEAKAPPTHWQASVQSHRDAAFRKVYEEFKTKEASRIRADVQRLEDKAVNIACKSSSVAELNSICNELQDWLSREYNKVPEGEHVSLLMSAALLRSILNERTKHTKGTESTKGAES
ncbi:hypothetical protein BD410DRAFT_731155 [Rickenella mellea]|uniref:RING-type domain-containing protein n=1 Tax=Rickenella mellea TaxID=50990 RepID=A0A4Y7PNE8_9AGAM|nr:hypothetical protein BD410DRAFT_731155 [Rickenella mellea]